MTVRVVVVVVVMVPAPFGAGAVVVVVVTLRRGWPPACATSAPSSPALPCCPFAPPPLPPPPPPLCELERLTEDEEVAAALPFGSWHSSHTRAAGELLRNNKVRRRRAH